MRLTVRLANRFTNFPYSAIYSIRQLLTPLPLLSVRLLVINHQWVVLNIPQLIEPSSREISIRQCALRLGYIIAGNCICSGFICLCLWRFSQIDNLSPWQKCVLNALSLLLSGILGFGVGLLLNRISLLARDASPEQISLRAGGAYHCTDFMSA